MHALFCDVTHLCHTAHIDIMYMHDMNSSDRLVPSETPCLLENISLGRTDGTVRAQTILSLTQPLTRAMEWSTSFLLKF
jgi:hypothetical protein